MARYMTLASGKKVLVTGTNQSTGVADAAKIIETGPDGKIDISLLPPGIAADVKVLEAFEALDAGDYVNIFDDGGTEKVRKADNSNGRPAHGFVKDAVAITANATVYFEGPNDDLSGLTAGQRVYLGTGGDIITTPLDPVTEVGKIHQFLGVAVDATMVNTDIADCIQL